MAGKLVVIDGADGSGKATQTTLLVERLRADGKQVETLDFPQYEANQFGKLLRESLDGKHGDFLNLDPRLASTIYAADRFESAPKLLAWLEAGAVVVLDRYVSSNMLHQTSKIKDETERAAFLDWLDTIEHEVFGIPRPDLILYLDIPYDVRQQFMEQDHTRASLDMVERDENYNRVAEEQAKELLVSKNNWKQVTCTEGAAPRTREAIHEDVYALVNAVL